MPRLAAELKAELDIIDEKIVCPFVLKDAPSWPEETRQRLEKVFRPEKGEVDGPAVWGKVSGFKATARELFERSGGESIIATVRFGCCWKAHQAVIFAEIYIRTLSTTDDHMYVVDENQWMPGLMLRAQDEGLAYSVRGDVRYLGPHSKAMFQSWTEKLKIDGILLVDSVTTTSDSSLVFTDIATAIELQKRGALTQPLAVELSLMALYWEQRCKELESKLSTSSLYLPSDGYRTSYNSQETAPQSLNSANHTIHERDETISEMIGTIIEKDAAIREGQEEIEKLNARILEMSSAASEVDRTAEIHGLEGEVRALERQLDFERRYRRERRGSTLAGESASDSGVSKASSATVEGDGVSTHGKMTAASVEGGDQEDWVFP